MKKTILLFLLAFIGLSTASAQVGIGTTSPDASAILELDANDKGFLPPRLSTAQRNVITSPAEGLTIFNTTVNCLQWYNGTGWFDACDGSTVVPPGPLSDCASGFIPPFLTAAQTVVKDVTNPITGDTWMDRNLGAYTADRTPPSPTGGTDCWAYGNLYQWGRNSDGHENRNSNETPGPVAAGSEGSDFITVGNNPFDWLSTQDDTRWNGATKGVHDPCPDGYRVPTEAEWEAEWDSWDGTLDNSVPASSNNNREGAITTPLKLPVAGFRDQSTGELRFVGSYGLYWSSTVPTTRARRLFFQNSDTSMLVLSYLARGYSVRCLKD